MYVTKLGKQKNNQTSNAEYYDGRKKMVRGIYQTSM